MNLVEQQRLFYECVTGWGATDHAHAAFVGTKSFSVGQRLHLYRSMYRIRIGEALLKTFPRLAERLGESVFRRVAMQYLDCHPSSDPRLEFVGRYLPAYLQSLSEARISCYAPLAGYEWARQFAMLAPDPSEIVSAIQLEPEIFCVSHLDLIPSLRIVELDSQWRAIWCEDKTLFERILGRDEAAALGKAQSGEVLPGICECFDGAPDPVVRAFGALRAWIDRRWIVRVGRVSPKASS